MRLLHTSDWHLGRTLFATALIDHQRDFLVWLVDYVREHAVDGVLISGDVYDRAVPSVEAVGLLEWALIELSRLTDVVLIPGNHDSATRLGFAGPLLEAARVHVRANAADVDRPVLLNGGGTGQVAVFGIPYLEPTFHAERFTCDRTHEAVLRSAMDRVREHEVFRQAVPVVVVAHAFITGGIASDSERDVRVGGIADAPVSVFEGADYVALGHLHRPQGLTAPGAMVCRYSGSPLAYSFSEEGQEKSVTLIEVSPEGAVTTTTVPTPVPRALTTIHGTLEELLSDERFDGFRDDWVRAILTDQRRPERPMDRLRERFPNTLQLEFAPVDGKAIQAPRSADISTQDPVSVASQFIEYVTGTDASPGEVALIADAVEQVRLKTVH
ncbi:MAG: exonuclease SbcCD subunit D [Candidatus Nanopelagicales bacterium]